MMMMTTIKVWDATKGPLEVLAGSQINSVERKISIITLLTSRNEGEKNHNGRRKGERRDSRRCFGRWDFPSGGLENSSWTRQSKSSSYRIGRIRFGAAASANSVVSSDFCFAQGHIVARSLKSETGGGGKEGKQRMRRYASQGTVFPDSLLNSPGFQSQKDGLADSGRWPGFATHFSIFFCVTTSIWSSIFRQNIERWKKSEPEFK